MLVLCSVADESKSHVRLTNSYHHLNTAMCTGPMIIRRRCRDSAVCPCQLRACSLMACAPHRLTFRAPPKLPALFLPPKSPPRHPPSEVSRQRSAQRLHWRLQLFCRCFRLKSTIATFLTRSSQFTFVVRQVVAQVSVQTIERGRRRGRDICCRSCSIQS